MENCKGSYVGIAVNVEIDLGKVPTNALIEELMCRTDRQGIKAVEDLAYEYFNRRLNPRRRLNENEATPE